MLSHLRSMIASVTGIAVLAAIGCGSGSNDGGGPDAAGESPDAGPGASCARDLGPADRARYVVISLPYDDQGAKAKAWSVWQLSTEGALTDLGHRFEMGRGWAGNVVFTPDGEIGLVAQEDGKVGAFRLDADGKPEVIDAALDVGASASSVVMDPSGERAYVLSNQWREHGGGVWALDITCEGEIRPAGQVFSSRLPAAMLWVDDKRAVIAAEDVMESAADLDLHLLSWDSDPSVMASAALFEGDGAVVASAAIGPGSRYVLVGDNAAFSEVPNRVAVAEITSSGLEMRQVLQPIEDPYSLAISPFDGTALVMSGFGDAIFQLEFDAGNPTAPYSMAGQLAYKGPKPQIPGSTAMVERGALKGLVLVAENTSIRQIQFPPEGGARDLGGTPVGDDGFTSIPGVIGIQP